jgi:hypothetical protein
MRLQWRTDDAVLEVTQASLCKVLDLAFVDVVKQRIDRQVSSLRILQWCANSLINVPIETSAQLWHVRAPCAIVSQYHLARNTRAFGVGLAAKIEKVDPDSKHLCCGSLEMLALIGVALNDTDAVVFQAFELEVLVDPLSKVLAKTVVQRDVDIIRLLHTHTHTHTHTTVSDTLWLGMWLAWSILDQEACLEPNLQQRASRY